MTASVGYRKAAARGGSDGLGEDAVVTTIPTMKTTTVAASTPRLPYT